MAFGEPAAIAAGGGTDAARQNSVSWPDGQAVKTSPFHGGNPGSIPGRVTRKSVQPEGWADFFCVYLSGRESKPDVGDRRNAEAPAGRPPPVYCEHLRCEQPKDLRSKAFLIPGRVTRKSVQPVGWADFFVSTSPAGNRSQTWVTGEEIIPIFELDEIVR